MKMPKDYREDTKHCRDLLDHPVEPELRVQLRLWAAELDDIADAIECGAEASAPRSIASAMSSNSAAHKRSCTLSSGSTG